VLHACGKGAPLNATVISRTCYALGGVGGREHLQQLRKPSIETEVTPNPFLSKSISQVRDSCPLLLLVSRLHARASSWSCSCWTDQRFPCSNVLHTYYLDDDVGRLGSALLVQHVVDVRGLTRGAITGVASTYPTSTLVCMDIIYA
jgi:hypothetical protein